MQDDANLQPAGPERQHSLAVSRVSATVSRIPSAAVVPPPGAPANINVAALVHGALRGRYSWVIALSIVTGILAGGLTWRFARPEYRSSGLLRIAYNLPEVMQETDQNKPIMMFDAFMASQRLLITSRRVIDTAIQDPIWKAMGKAVPEKPDQYFANNLSVDTKARSEFISISVQDKDPGTAAAAVTSIINAYTEMYNSENKRLERQRSGVLEDRQSDLKQQINQLANQIRAGAQEFGSTNLDVFYGQAAARTTKLKSALDDVRLALATHGTPMADTQPATQSAEEQAAGSVPATRPILTEEQIAGVDPVMHGHMEEVKKLERELERYALLGYLADHKDVQMSAKLLEAAKARATKYAETFREFQGTTALNLGASTAARVDTTRKTVAELRADEASLTKLLQEATDEMKAVGNKRLELQQQEKDLLVLRNELEILTRRIEVLRAEGALGGRLSVINSGEIPLSPAVDRRLKFAGAGAVAGAGLPVMAVVGLSLLRRRYRYSNDAQSDANAERIPLLGILPELKAGKPDGEQMLAAAHCIHQIRVTLRSQARQTGAQAYLVTSAAASEGKTSLALSLALSFSAARFKTLVVDGDMVGRRLTTVFDAGKSLGLREALAAGQLRGQVRKTTAGFYVLTAGQARIQDACAIAPGELRILLEEARRHFDVILLDSGPIMGSVEATVLAQEVDGVIFTITRGQDKCLVHAALRRLESLGVNDVGLVFNRAKRADVYQSTYGSSSLTSSAAAGDILDPLAQPEAKARIDRLSRFGPLVQAVASGMPAGRWEDASLS